MPIVLYNSTAKGKFMKYTSIGGITKSVWVDAFKECLVPEINDTSALVNKLDRSRIETAERLSNSKTLGAYILKEKLNYLKDVTNEPRWQKKITTRFTGKIGIIMTVGERKYAFSVSALSDLETIGSTVYSAGSFPVQLSSSYNGTYVYNSNSIEIVDGVIKSINGFSGSDSYTLRNIIGTTNYTVYVEDGASVFANGTQFYQDAGLENTYPLSITVRYDVPASNTNKKISLSSGLVNSSSNYTTEIKTYYLSGSSGTSYTLYNEVGVDVYDPSENPILFQDNQGIQNSALNATVFTLSPSYKYLIVASGRVLSSGDVDSGGGGSDSYVFVQGRANTTVYVSSGAAIQVGTTVYTDSGLTTFLAKGDYTYNGNTVRVGTSGVITSIV